MPEYTCTSCGFATALCVCSDGPRDPETGRTSSAAYRSQRLLRVRVGSSIPAFWRFVQWVGKETNMLTGEWEDVVLCEYDPEWVEAK